MKEKKSSPKMVKTKNPELIEKQRSAIISYYAKKRKQEKNSTKK